ncbi:branched-chain amino acid ABC transporter permease [Nocardioides sp. AN3]
MERTGTARGHRLILVIFALLLLLPSVLSLGEVYLAASIAINVLLALSLMTVMGYGGYFSLGQGVVFGIGAYTVAILGDRTGWDLLILLPVAAVGGAIAGAAMAVTCLRTTHLYLAMVTLAYSFVLGDVATNWTSLSGGGQGIIVLSTLGGAPVAGKTLYFLALVAIGVTLGVLLTVRHNRIGRAQGLTRASEVAGRCVGINTNRLMVNTFAASGVVAAIAGGLYASFIGLVDPSSFDFDRTVATLTIVVIAGVRSPFTVMVIAPVLLYLQNSSGNEALANWIPLVYACLVIVVLRVAPQGIGGIRLRLTRQLTAWSVRSPEGMQGVRHDRSPCRNRPETKLRRRARGA